MKLHRFKINGLFGLFDHEIDLEEKGHITILHSPNGFGKTVMLKMISGFFGGSLLPFRTYEYTSVVFILSDGTEITITKKDKCNPDLSDVDRKINDFTISAIVEGELQSFTSGAGASWNDWRHYPAFRLERAFSDIARPVAPSRWRVFNTAEVLTTSELWERYSDVIPLERGARPNPHPEWLSDLRRSIPCRLIETNRLENSRLENREREREGLSSSPVVMRYAKDLSNKVERILAESANISQSLDRTFPKRVLSSLRVGASSLSEDGIRSELRDLDIMRQRLAKVDLIDIADENSLISTDHFNEDAGKVLIEYVNDNWKKLNIFREILTKMELFLEIINSRFKYKTIEFDRKDGFIFKDYKENVLHPGSLSSGEQHEIVLNFELIFNTQSGTLLLIDEPEISLHIAWQRRFLKDLRRVIELTDIDVLIATHSPQLVGEDLDLVVSLTGPEFDQ